MNRYLVLVLLVIFLFCLTGCWNYKEISDFYIVAGVAIDKDNETGEFIVTTELINIKDNQLSPGYESIKVESKGNGIYEAIITMTRTSAKRLIWSHATTLIISQEVAKDGIAPLLDWFIRDIEPRLNIDVFISGEETAKELLGNESLPTDIRSFEFDIMINKNQDHVRVPVLKIYELINELYLPKNHAVLPIIRSVSNSGRVTNTLTGGAIFTSDRLVGFLNQEDIIQYTLIKNMANKGFIKVNLEEGYTNSFVILEIFNQKTKIKPSYAKDNISFDIKVIADVAIAELDTKTDYISKSGRELLKIKSEEYVATQIESTINKVQKQFGFDIFGFGNIIRHRDPHFWKEIEKDWDLLFSESDFNINCQLNIRSSGHFSKPIEVNK